MAERFAMYTGADENEKELLSFYVEQWMEGESTLVRTINESVDRNGDSTDIMKVEIIVSTVKKGTK